MSLLKFLGLQQEQAPSVSETDTVRRIVHELDQLPPDRGRFLAGFAYILSRVARADSSVSDEETRAMERLVMERGHLPEEQAVLVVQIAKTQNLLFGATENFLVTREFSRISTREEKLGLLDCLFAVSAADESISGAEDHMVRQIARELNLEHSDFIAARSAYRGHLGFLKR